MARVRPAAALVLAASLAILAGGAGPLGPSAEAAPPPHAASQARVPETLVLKLRPGASTAQIEPLLTANGASIDRAVGKDGVLRIRLARGDDGSALLAALGRNASVEQAAYDLVVTKFDAPSDPAYPRQWHLHTTTGGIGAEGAWDLSPARGSGVVVAVIDTGVAYEDRSGEQGLLAPKTFGRAPDLAGVAIVTPWDWIGTDSHANDENGHGTHVAGTILQGTNNGISGAGMSAASLMPLRILDFAGNGQGSDLIDAIYYAADNGADVINLSLGFTGTGTPDANGAVCSEIVGLAAALEYADAMGVAVIAAAGNDGGATVACPAAYPTVTSVGATRFDGAVTFYSNRGAALDVAAPGGDPNADQNGDGEADQVVQQGYCYDLVTLLFTGRYDVFCDVGMSGTSMATPHVSGLAAIMKAQHPTLSPAQLRDVLQATARDRGVPGWDAEYGFGAVDATAALASLIADPPPLPPPGPDPVPRPVPQPGATNVTATALNTSSIRLNWTDNASNETGFRIDRSSDGGTSWTQAGTAGANATSYTNYGLAAGTQYHYRLRSYDSLGSSPWSAVVSATTVPPPSAPENAAAVALSGTRMLVTWTDTSTTEGGFRVERSTDGVNFTTTYVSANATQTTVSNLQPETEYWFRVRAYDGNAVSPPSNTAQATTYSLPAPPANLVAASLSTTSVRLDWTDMSTTESGFRVERSVDGGTTWTQVGTLAANATTWTNYNLIAGTAYAYRVRGYDGMLNGDPSNVAVATTDDAPSAPEGLVATALSTTRIGLTWTDTSSNEGGFKVERSLDGVGWSQVGYAGTNATTYAASGLVPGTTYYFRVRAYQGTTNGAYSQTVSATTLPPPSAPTNLAALAKNSNSVVLTWTNTSPYQTGLRVERSLDGASWTQVAVLSATAVTYTNSSLLPETIYQFRVRAVEGTTLGQFTDAVSVSTFPLPSAPVGLTATLYSATSVKLTWTDTCSYESGFRVERSLDGVTWTQVATLGANASSWFNFSLAAHTTYYYRVRAHDGSAGGPYSAVVVYTTP